MQEDISNILALEQMSRDQSMIERLNKQWNMAWSTMYGDFYKTTDPSHLYRLHNPTQENHNYFIFVIVFLTTLNSKI